MSRDSIETEQEHEVLAAGGVLVRADGDQPRVAAIHRPKYADWSLPKGKLEDGESFEQAALREVEEETGFEAELGRELSRVAYRDRNGRSKLVRYWSMRPLRGEFEPGHEVDELRWLTPADSERLLDYPHDRELVREALDKPVQYSPAMASREAVRTPIAVATAPRRRRTPGERALLRFSALGAFLAAAILRLPPRSRLRRSFLSRALQAGYEAVNRRDFEFVLGGYHPDVEVRYAGSLGLLPPDMAGGFRGHEGYRRMWQVFVDAFEDARLEPEYMIDTGDRILVAARVLGRGKGSGVPFQQRYCEVFTYRGGRVIRHEMFVHRDEGLATLGLTEPPR